MKISIKNVLLIIIVFLLWSASSVYANQNLPFGRIFYSKLAGNLNIFYQDGDLPPIQLTSHSSNEIAFDLSPDGSEIVYGRNPYEIRIMDAEVGDSASRAIQTGSYVVHPRFSPDGQDVVFHKGSATTAEIYIIPKAATPNDQPFRVTSDCGAEENPNWSPDGSMLVFADTHDGVCSYRSWDLYMTIINRDGTNRRMLLDEATGQPFLSAGNYSHIWKVDESGMHRILFFQGKWPSPCCQDSLKIAEFSLPNDPISTEPIYATLKTVFVSYPPNRGVYLGDWDDEGRIWFTWINAGNVSRICVIDDSGDINSPICEPETSSTFFGIVQFYPLNQPPTEDAGGPYSGFEASPIIFSEATATDPDKDHLNYSWTVDNPVMCSFDDSSTLNSYLTCSDNGIYEVTLTVDDGINDPVSDSTTVTVGNVSPTVDVGEDITIHECGSCLQTGTFTDPGADTWTATVDYGDASGDTPLALVGKTFDISHTYDEPGAYTVTVTVMDDDGGNGVDTVVVTVLSVEEAITAVRDDLVTLIDDNPGTPLVDKVEDVLEKANTALDELDKTPSDRQAAMGALEGAIGDLEAAVKDSLLDTALGEQWMEQLVASARCLATNAIEEATAQGGDSGEIDDAQQYLGEGDTLSASGDYKDSVSKYKDALAKAESALQ